MTDPLAVAPDLPQGTPDAGDQTPTASTPPTAPPPADPERDAAGEVWDARWHVSPPRKNIKGRWAGKPGNAARLRAGKPPVNAFGGGAAPAAPAGQPAPDAAPPTAPPDAPPPPVASRLVWEEPSSDPLAKDAVPVVERPREAYAATARSVVTAQFGVAQMALGPAWEPKDGERKAWENAWQDLMHHYQMPIVGPILGLIILAIDSTSKRWKDPDTRERFKALWNSLTGSMRRVTPPPPPPPAEPPRPQAQPRFAGDDNSRAYGPL